MRVEALLLTALVACGDDGSSVVDLPPEAEESIESLCENASECISELSMDGCLDDLGSVRTADMSCLDAIDDFETCVADLSCTDVEADFRGCEDDARVFEQNCLVAPASCDSPCGDCETGFACVPTDSDDVVGFECQKKADRTGGKGDPCSPESVGCDNGYVCALASSADACEGNDYCCTPYCCVTEPDCGSGEQCLAVGDTEVGLCGKELTAPDINTCAEVCQYVEQCIGFETEEFGASEGQCLTGCEETEPGEREAVFSCLRGSTCEDAGSIQACEPMDS